MSELATTALPDAACEPSLPASLYIHVPFCLSKCAYCDFASAVSDARRHAPFVDAVLFAASHWASYGLLDDAVTLYLGGGTPTILGDELVRLVAGLRDIAVLRDEAEITVETNPDTTDERLIAALVDAGVNRFSLGVQSLDDRVLTILGRRHDARRASIAARILADSGQRFSVDLICGVPGQSVASWRDTLAGAIETGAGHVSVYPLAIEDGTPLASAVDAGTLPEPDSDAAAAMMLLAEETLRGAGIERYEVANYARPGQESRHNTVYWTGGAYLGLGPSASSMLPAERFALVANSEGWPLPAETAARTRFTTTDDTAAFLRRPLAAPREIEHLTTEETAREDVMLGMRLTCGVPAEQVDSTGLTAVFETLADDGLVERSHPAASPSAVASAALSSPGDRWRTTERGWLLGNEVFGRIWAGE